MQRRACSFRRASGARAGALRASEISRPSFSCTVTLPIDRLSSRWPRTSVFGALGRSSRSITIPALGLSEPRLPYVSTFAGTSEAAASISVVEDALVLEFGPGEQAMQRQLQRKENRELLGREAERVLGRRVELRFGTEAAASASPTAAPAVPDRPRTARA